MSSWIGDNADLITLSGEGQPSAESFREDRRPENKRQRTLSSAMLAAGYFAAFIGIVTGLLTGLSFHATHDALAQWPHRQAIVDSCENYQVQVQHGAEAPTWSFEYGFRCHLSYSPQSVLYDALVDIGYRSSNPNEMAAWSIRIHSGDRIPIIYDPKNPSHAHFATDFHAAYAPALHSLHFVISTALVSLGLIAFGRQLRPANPLG